MGSGGESPVCGRARAEKAKRAHISAGEPGARRTSAEAGEPRARARCNRSANGSRVRYSVESNAQPTTRRSAHRRTWTCACLGIGYRARRESTHSAGQPRTYRPGSAQHVPTPHTGRSGEAERKTARGPACGTEDRAWARLRFRAPRPPLCGRAPPTHLAPAVDLHWPWWLAHIADRISGTAQVSPVTEGAPHTVAHRHIHIADGSPVTPIGAN